MTGPAVVQKPTVPRILTGDEWEQSQYAPHRAGDDPTAPAGPGRILTGDEWEQARSAGSVTGLRFPSLPKIAPAARDVTQTPATSDFKGKPLAPFDIKNPSTYANPILRQLVNPVLEHPVEGAAMLAAIPAAPVIAAVSPLAAAGVAVAGAGVAGSMVYHIAQYGWQKAAELQLSPEDRARAEADPERISGEAAAVQAAMLGLAPLIHVTAKSFKGPGFGEGMTEAGAAGLRDVNFGPKFSPGFADATANSRFAAGLARGVETARTPIDINRPKGFQPSVVASAPTTSPRQVPGIEVPTAVKPGKIKPLETEPANAPLQAAGALHESVREYQAQRLAQEQDELSQSRSADAEAIAKEAASRPVRRPGGVKQVPFFESPQGAETLGAMAARHGLPDEAVPYHPASPLAEAWKNGHDAATGSYPLNAAAFTAEPQEAPRSGNVRIENTAAGGIVARSPDGYVGGAVRDNALHIASAHLDEGARGIGRGVELYRAAIDEAHGRGLSVVSDKTVEAPAVRVYEALERRGYDVQRNPNTKALEDGTLYVSGSNVSEPVFTVGPRSPQSYPEGFSMGGALTDNRIPPDFKPPRTPKTEPDALVAALKPSPLRGHTDSELADATRTAQEQVELAERTIAHEASRDAPDHEVIAAAETQAAHARTALEQAQREQAMRGGAGEPPYKGPASLYSRLSDDALGAQYRSLVEKRATDQPASIPPLLNEERDALAVEQIENRRRPDGSLSPEDKRRLANLQRNQGEGYGGGRHTFESAAAAKRVEAYDRHIASIEREMAGRGLNPERVLQESAVAPLDEESPFAPQNPVNATVGGLTPPLTEPGALASVAGTGDVKPRGLAAGVEEKAVASKLTQSLGDIPEYRTVSMADQASRATQLLTDDPALARQVALGQANAPRGLLPESVFVAVENRAIQEGDVATLRDLATGGLTEEATTMGQRIRALGERDPDSPVAAIKAVSDARGGGAVSEPKIRGAVSELQAHLAKAAEISHEEWSKFVDALRCR